MAELAPLPATIRTVVHFHKYDDPSQAVEIERDGDARCLDTGAFMAARWEKPEA
ncbi:Methyltransferase type 11 (fragment) [Syntrophobacter sp. SbD1]